jgi:hypothetical protein
MEYVMVFRALIAEDDEHHPSPTGRSPVLARLPTDGII